MHIASLPMEYKIRYVFKARGFDPKRSPQSIHIAIALPDNFDPHRSENKIAIVSQTADADASSIIHMEQYYKAITNAGWVCIAVDVDGEESDRKAWNHLDDRYALVYNALETMHLVWPQSKAWEYAAFGFSGGAGYTNYIAAELAKEKYNLVGTWAGGSNYTDQHFVEGFEPTRAYSRAKYFLSFGEHDEIVPPHSEERGRAWGEKRFRDFRCETYDGGHSIYQPHLEAALIWFNE